MDDTTKKSLEDYTLGEVKRLCKGRATCASGSDRCPFYDVDGVCGPGNIPAKWKIGPQSLQELGESLGTLINGILERLATALGDIEAGQEDETDTITFTSAAGQTVTIELNPDADDDGGAADDA